MAATAGSRQGFSARGNSIQSVAITSPPRARKLRR